MEKVLTAQLTLHSLHQYAKTPFWGCFLCYFGVYLFPLWYVLLKMLLNCVTKFYNKHFLAAGEDLKYSESEFLSQIA